MSPFADPPRDLGPAATVAPQVDRPWPLPRTTSPTIEALVADPTPERRARFWRRVAQEGTPLVDEIPGHPQERVYTFVHRGEDGARRVLVDVDGLVDVSTYRDALMSRIPGTTLWSLSLRLPASWRATYGIAVDDDHGATADERTAASVAARRERARAASDPGVHAALDDWFDLLLRSEPDPLAREHALLGADTVASGPDAPAPPAGVGGVVVGEQPEPGPRGRTVPVAGFGEPGAGAAGRRAWWHVPPVEPGPDGWDVVVLLDGDRWLGAGVRALDRAFATGALRPAAVLLVGCGDRERRLADLACSHAYVRRLAQVLDDADAEVLGAPLTRDPARTTIAGHDFGGLAALWAQCVAPERFGASVCQSGAWWWPSAPDDGGPGAPAPEEWLTGAVERAAADPAWGLGRVHLEVGEQEWALREPTRRLHDALAGRCESLTVARPAGGHDPACWAVQLLGALSP